jgi:hypothetical protein
MSALVRRSIGWPAYIRWLFRCWRFSRREQRAIDRLIAESGFVARTREGNRAYLELIRRAENASSRHRLPPTHRDMP